MAKRRCRHCPHLVPTDAYRGLCDECRHTWDRERGSREDRGYGADHQAERAQYASLIRAGITIRCVTCNTILGPDFHLGHTDDRTTWVGPQCPLCNDRRAGQASHTPPNTPRRRGLDPPNQHRR